ncbi:MAG: iron ABC transporter permease, partial [Clostridiales Family XIII bacterium]|nr:iron ABC transporter permease [Clostridiales Family XIII bacterium]
MTEKHSDRENRTARQTDSGSAGQAGDVNGAGDSGNAGQAGDVNGAGNSCSTEYAGSTGDSGSAGLAGAAGAPGGVATQDELLVQKAARARSRIRFRLFMGGAGTLLILLALTCVCVGEYPMQPGTALHILAGKLSGAVPDWLPMQENVLFGLRLPRVAASMLVGCALAVSGAAFQGVFKNPLVSPDFLGVSSGATVGAASAILLSLGSALMQGFAFLGGLAAVLLTMSIPRLLRASSNIMLVLSGIIVGGLMSSVLGLLKYLADPDTQLADIVYWQMGSFSYVELRPLLAILPVVVLPAIVLLGLSWRI